ncbi:GCN5-related N-acetyltransferase [Alicyclobacillus acidocaldarius subsp. acidocaldarius Tc-4-1]|uniref:GCN5-related N-acetyltransferase n=2 Tax=Alicyclobacillus acidocaldarius TaxID=405212 RepID=F8IG34_ALIAT|nr:GCN5-related N-acetyltransferase [Alicyclobacillus acidocaldarius subsp. acidocaldarius Tc-4-1]
MDVITFRAARPADLEGVGRVHVETWRQAYRGVVPSSFLARMDPAMSAERFRKRLSDPKQAFWVALAGEDVVGFASGGPNRLADFEADAEIYTLYVCPSWQGRGIGRRLVGQLADWFKQQGHQSVAVVTFRANPWRRFYERLGGRIAGEKTFEVDGVALPEVVYCWSDVEELRERAKRGALRGEIDSCVPLGPCGRSRGNSG